jgi:hypothetical protein
MGAMFSEAIFVCTYAWPGSVLVVFLKDIYATTIEPGMRFDLRPSDEKRRKQPLVMLVNKKRVLSLELFFSVIDYT